MKRPTELALIMAGIDEEYQCGVTDGIIDFAKKNNTNISCFSAFCGVVSGRGFDVGENNIYSLINFKMFDGVILMINTIPDVEIKQKLIAVTKASMLPVVVFECDDQPQFLNIAIDNKNSISEIVRHIVEKHGARDIAYISGPKSNPEALLRLTAFCDVLSASGIRPDEKNIFIGDFRPVSGRDAVQTMLSDGRKLPDAIVCANDAMALAAIKELEDNGISVPKDVIVTGFDNIYNARHLYPALTTVDRPLAEAGYAACEMLIKAINGEKWEKTRHLEATPIFSESCGCVDRELSDIKTYRKKTYDIIDNSRSNVRLLNSLTSEMAEADTAEECMRIIGEMAGELECEKICICLCDDWISSYSVKTENSLVHGYTPKMSAPLIWNKGEISEVKCFRSSNMDPRPYETGGNISHYLPLHFRERCLGYVIISNGDFPRKSLVCHSLMMSISEALENIRKLLNLNNVIEELDRMYVIDPLCNIYNRNGFIREADTMFNECRMLGQKILICFVDMDGLKYINDNYGHSEGDIALRTLASVLKDSCDDSMVCARFGGDEFIIVGKNAEEEDVPNLEKSLGKRIKHANELLAKPYGIECSIGSLVTRISDDMTLFKLITKADEIMYEQKKRKRNSKYLRRY
ncbi:GGDEF domain-containing protein [Ruminococcus sp.]|uniref:GGDEF domain-containing protein n=1 Tax=Ruminococcus sp. TaxID=41978 RepID=UPI0025D8665A|nr:GGDEF domain-containing protein [Ruminococcus sp.]MBQ8968024.1 GGDEF domain-containing protein [Ruminococcus sp.]